MGEFYASFMRRVVKRTERASMALMVAIVHAMARD